MSIKLEQEIRDIVNGFKKINIKVDDKEIRRLFDDLFMTDFFITSNFNKDIVKDEIISILKCLLNKDIPDSYSKDVLSNMALRFKVIPIQGYSIISKDWVKLLTDWIGNRKCLEIMSGKGTLSYALQSEGVSIIPTDVFKWSQFNFSDLWTNVEQIDALDAIEKYGSDVDIIIMSWCYMDDLGYKSLLKMREINPDAVMIYIGEGKGGCTGSDLLYDSMIEIEDTKIDAINDIYPSWFGIHDRLHLIK